MAFEQYDSSAKPVEKTDSAPENVVQSEALSLLMLERSKPSTPQSLTGTLEVTRLPGLEYLAFPEDLARTQDVFSKPVERNQSFFSAITNEKPIASGDKPVAKENPMMLSIASAAKPDGGKPSEKPFIPGLPPAERTATDKQMVPGEKPPVVKEKPMGPGDKPVATEKPLILSIASAATKPVIGDKPGEKPVAKENPVMLSIASAATKPTVGDKPGEKPVAKEKPFIPGITAVEKATYKQMAPGEKPVPVAKEKPVEPGEKPVAKEKPFIPGITAVEKATYKQMAPGEKPVPVAKEKQMEPGEKPAAKEKPFIPGITAIEKVTYKQMAPGEKPVPVEKEKPMEPGEKPVAKELMLSIASAATGEKTVDNERLIPPGFGADGKPINTPDGKTLSIGSLLGMTVTPSELIARLAKEKAANDARRERKAALPGIIG